MNNDELKITKQHLNSKRRYPPFWEKSVPYLITFAALAAVSLIFIALYVIFTNTGS